MTETVEERSRELRRQIARKQADRLQHHLVETVFDPDVTYDPISREWKKAS
jgi:hypothetical protein